MTGPDSRGRLSHSEDGRRTDRVSTRKPRFASIQLRNRSWRALPYSQALSSPSVWIRRRSTGVTTVPRWRPSAVRHPAQSSKTSVTPWPPASRSSSPIPVSAWVHCSPLARSSRSACQARMKSAAWGKQRVGSWQAPNSPKQPPAQQLVFPGFCSRPSHRNSSCRPRCCQAHTTATFTQWIGGSESNRQLHSSPPSRPIQSWPVVVPK